MDFRFKTKTRWRCGGEFNFISLNFFYLLISLADIKWNRFWIERICEEKVQFISFIFVWLWMKMFWTILIILFILFLLYLSILLLMYRYRVYDHIWPLKTVWFVSFVNFLKIKKISDDNLSRIRQSIDLAKLWKNLLEWKNIFERKNLFEEKTSQSQSISIDRESESSKTDPSLFQKNVEKKIFKISKSKNKLPTSPIKIRVNRIKIKHKVAKIDCKQKEKLLEIIRSDIVRFKTSKDVFGSTQKLSSDTPEPRPSLID